MTEVKGPRPAAVQAGASREIRVRPCAPPATGAIVMPGNPRKFAETLLGSQRELSFSTLGRDGYPESVVTSYASEGLVVFMGLKAQGHQVRNLASSAKACVTVVSDEEDWGDVRGVTLRGNAKVLDPASPECERARELLRRTSPRAERRLALTSAPLAFVRFEPIAAVVLDHWDGIGFTELVDLRL